MTGTTAAAATITGGVFYIIGGFTLGKAITVGILPVGLIAGTVIMIGAILIQTMRPWVVRIGGALAIIGALFAAAHGCGGLLIGLALTLVGSISALGYKGQAVGDGPGTTEERGR